MVLTPSTMVSLGSTAPDFSLPDPSGKVYSLKDVAGSSGVLVAFICNHCPYVKHVAEGLKALSYLCQEKGVGMAAINSNDIGNYPDDAPSKMVEMEAANSWAFPYLIDEDQSIAKSYRAACTPDFFLYDKDLKLFYRGQLDSSRPGNDIPVTGEDLFETIYLLEEGKPAPAKQTPSMGCNIKWKPGNEPDYFG